MIRPFTRVNLAASLAPDHGRVLRYMLCLLLIVPGGHAAYGQADDEIIFLDAEDDEDAVFILDGEEDEGDRLIVEDDGDSLIIEAEADDNEMLIVDDHDAGGSELTVDGDEADGLLIEEESGESYSDFDAADATEENGSALALKLDELWLEQGFFTDSDAAADLQTYVHAQATLNWESTGRWQAQLSGRVDGYYQRGDEDSSATELDYGESFIRYIAENYRVTVGAQKVLWGRIDEFPPLDRLSTQDFSRVALDDLADRRRASPSIRYEFFRGDSSFDFMATPYFREAELPEKDSVWFPVNRRDGRILGLESSPDIANLIRNAAIDLDTTNSESSFAFRYKTLSDRIDYGFSVQHGPQNIPYFTYDTASQTIEVEYEETWVLGSDMAYEIDSGVLRFELAWLSDSLVTDLAGEVSSKESLSWGVAYEFFPGDGDARVNLQILGNNIFNTGEVLDRTDVYYFGGSFETPLANQTWRVKTRFQFGLDERDVYINPEVAYTGWPAQDVYLEAHFFEGSNGTVGGFYQDNSMLTLGWRRKF